MLLKKPPYVTAPKETKKEKNNIKNLETKLKSLDDQLAIDSSPQLTIKRREIKTEFYLFY